MLQEYVMIPLDIFKQNMQNKTVENKMEAWLTFFSEDRPEKIIGLINDYPQFKAMYQTIYDICLNTERVMEMFSKELRELDRNTEIYMFEEQQRIIDEQKEEIERNREEIAKGREEIAKSKEEIAKSKEEIAKNREELEQANELLAQKEKELEAVRKLLKEKGLNTEE